MFVHCFTVLVDEEWLRGHGVVGVEAMRVRINLCRTGVVNFFFGVTGGLPLLSEPEARLRPVCLALWHAVLQAV